LDGNVAEWIFVHNLPIVEVHRIVTGRPRARRKINAAGLPLASWGIGVDAPAA